MNRVIMIGATLLALAACDKKEEPKTEDPSTKNAVAEAKDAGVTTTAAPVAINDSDLATPADFEETAEKAITKANYKQELATIETSITSE